MQTVNAPPAHRLDLCKTTCEVRDDRWAIHLDAGDDPVEIRVAHRVHGDWDQWPEAAFDAKVRAVLRAYDLSDREVMFHTRGAALKAAHSFLKAYGSGEVEYLEWDVASQTMVVVGFSTRGRMFWPEPRPDQVAEYCAAFAPDAGRAALEQGS